MYKNPQLSDAPNFTSEWDSPCQNQRMQTGPLVAWSQNFEHEPLGYSSSHKSKILLGLRTLFLKAGLHDHIHIKFASQFLCDHRMWWCEGATQVAWSYVKQLKVIPFNLPSQIFHLKAGHLDQKRSYQRKTSPQALQNTCKTSLDV